MLITFLIVPVYFLVRLTMDLDAQREAHEQYGRFKSSVEVYFADIAIMCVSIPFIWIFYLVQGYVQYFCQGGEILDLW